MLERKFKIINLTGLDAKHSSILVTKSGKFTSDIKMHYAKFVVDLKSIMGVMSLNVHKGEIVKISINGIDEVEALEEISFLIQDLKLGKEY